MTMGLFNVESVNDIAEAINEQGVTGTFTVDEMGDAVREIEVGGGGVDVDTELSISSDKQRTTGAVTLTSELTGSDYVGVSDVNLNGHLENATVKFYKMNGATPNPQVDTLLNSSITNNGGVATCNVTLTETCTVYAYFEGITNKYPSSQSNTTQIEVITPIYAPSFDGTETIRVITSPVTTSNGILKGKCGYLTDGFDNTGLWTLECDIRWLSWGGGFELIIPNITRRDNSDMVVHTASGSGDRQVQIIAYNGSSSLGIIDTNCPVVMNDWYHLTITKNSNSSLTVSIGCYSANYTNWTHLSNEKLCIGIDSWGATTEIKNLVVY